MMMVVGWMMVVDIHGDGRRRRRARMMIDDD